jgi:plasmid stability protein
MATLTIRNLPKDLVERIKDVAARNGRSMESELRDFLLQRYVTRQQVLEEIRNRPPGFPSATAREIRRWIETGRKTRKDAVTFGRFNRIERRKGECS